LLCDAFRGHGILGIHGILFMKLGVVVYKRRNFLKDLNSFNTFL
jgi:hypothetical protein